jgi:hypothetical protein
MSTPLLKLPEGRKSIEQVFGSSAKRDGTVSLFDAFPSQTIILPMLCAVPQPRADPQFTQICNAEDKEVAAAEAAARARRQQQP